MRTKKPARKYWEKFDTKCKGLLKKKGCNINEKATSLPGDRAIGHIDELIKLGIFSSVKKVTPEKWTRIIDATCLQRQGFLKC